MDNHKNSGFDDIHFHEKIRLAGRYNKDWKHATLSWFAGPDRFKRGGDHKSTNWRQKHQWLVENIEREVGNHDVNQDEKTLATTLATMYAPESTDVPADTVKHPWNGCLHSFQGFIQQLVSVHVRKRRGELTAHDADTHIQVKPCFRKKRNDGLGKTVCESFHWEVVQRSPIDSFNAHCHSIYDLIYSLEDRSTKTDLTMQLVKEEIQRNKDWRHRTQRLDEHRFSLDEHEQYQVSFLWKGTWISLKTNPIGVPARIRDEKCRDKDANGRTRE